MTSVADTLGCGSVWRGGGARTSPCSINAFDHAVSIRGAAQRDDRQVFAACEMRDVQFETRTGGAPSST